MNEPVESVLQKLALKLEEHYSLCTPNDCRLTEVEGLLRSALEPMLAELRGLQQCRNNVSAIIKEIPEFHSGEWGGDKEGWGFHFEVVKSLMRDKQAAEQALREARDINHDLASTRFAKWKQLRAENEKLRELLREITHALKLSFAGKNVRCADELISRAEALSPSPTPAPDTNTQSLCHAKPSPDSATPEEKK
jgi:hypothetical protein